MLLLILKKKISLEKGRGEDGDGESIPMTMAITMSRMKTVFHCGKEGPDGGGGGYAG